MATGPKLPDSPLELYTSPCPIEPPYLNKFWGPLVGVTIGGIAVLGSNYFRSRPILSGAFKYAYTMGFWGIVGKFADDYRVQYYAERDATYVHYMQLHPEDFPPYKRQKLGDLIETWVPIR